MDAWIDNKNSRKIEIKLKYIWIGLMRSIYAPYIPFVKKVAMWIGILSRTNTHPAVAPFVQHSFVKPYKIS